MTPLLYLAITGLAIAGIILTYERLPEVNKGGSLQQKMWGPLSHIASDIAEMKVLMKETRDLSAAMQMTMSRMQGTMAESKVLAASLNQAMTSSRKAGRFVALPGGGAAAKEAAAAVAGAVGALQGAGEHKAPGICKDTCSKARDGVCDDGRGGNLTKQTPGVNRVYCDLGTDCTDCGPWEGVAHGPTWKEDVGPIEWLMQQKVEVRLTQAPYEPRIFFAYTDPNIDFDESAHMQNSKMIEPVITEIFYQTLKPVCDPSQPGQKGLVVDVGGNFGWFSTFSAALGCKVISFEPVKRFRAFYEYSTSRNGVRGQIELYPNVVAPDTTKEYSMVLPAVGQWGATRVGDLASDQQSKEMVKAVRVDDIVGDQHVDLMKVDVEGFEPLVFSTSQRMLANNQVDNLVLEYAIGYYGRKLDQLELLPDMLLNFFDLGYKMVNVDWGVVFAPPNPSQGWSTPLPQLPEVVRKHSEYDKWSAQMAANRSLPGQKGPGSFPCPEMAEAGINTRAIPWAFWMTHPKGFHGHFQFNTNIWASKDSKLMKVGPVLGQHLWPFDKPMKNQWFPDSSQDFGIPFAHCPHAEPKSMVAMRCRCREPRACKKHEEAANVCAEKGLLGYID